MCEDSKNIFQKITKLWNTLVEEIEHEMCIIRRTGCLQFRFWINLLWNKFPKTYI